MKNFKLKTLLLSLISASLVIGGMSIGASYIAKNLKVPVETKAASATWSASTALPGTATAINGDSNVTIKVSSTNSYKNPIRVYANTTITITTGSSYYITSVVYEASSTGNYVTYAQNATVSPSKTPTVSGKNVTWSYTASDNAKTWTFKPGTQTRCSSITVNYSQSGTVSYKVTYNANGATSGTVPTDATSYAANATVTVLGNTGSLVKTGYTFSGWNTQADGNGTDRAVGSTFSITDNTTLYAKWTENASGGSYSLYSGALTEGDYIITYSSAAMKASITSGRLDYLAVTPSNDKITNPDASIVWHIAPSGNYWTIYNASTTKYAASTGAKNKAQLLDSGSDDKSLWTASGTSTYEFINKQNTTNSVNANLRKNGTYGFATYSTDTGGALTLYKNSHTVTVTGTTSILIDGTTTLTASCSDNTHTFTWSSSNTSVATVTSSGVVTGKSAGTAKITATCSGGGSGSITITVSEPTVEATGITFNPSSITMTCTRTTSFTATLTGGSGNYEKTISWTSNNTAVIPNPANSESGNSVTITPNRVLVRTTVTLTARVVTPGNATGTITITVNPISQATGMTFSPSSLTLYVGQQGSFIPSLTGGETGKETTISWTSSHPSIIAAPSNSQAGSSVSVTPGYVDTQTVVTLTGTVISPGNASNSISITVKPTQQATSMTFDPSSISMYGLDTESFTVTLGGGGPGYEKTIRWTSSNAKVIAAPSNCEDGDTVSITPVHDVVNITEVTLTGTVDITGGISNTIVITVMPESSKPLPALAYTLDCKPFESVRDDDASSNMDSLTSGSDYFKTGAEYVESVDSGTLFLGKMSYDSIKFSSSKVNGYMDITLASSGQLKATKIVLRIRGYDTDSSHATISVNEATSGQTGYLVSSTLPTNDFTLVEVPCNEKNAIQTISITATKRLYLDYIEVWARPREASGMTFNPTSVTVESGTSTSFIPTLTGGTNGYEQTINWVSSNPSLIPSPKSTEEGEHVIITAKEGILSNTDVTITGTVASPGYATATINVTITPYVPVDHYTATGTAYGVEGESKWNLSEVYLHAWRDAGETVEKDLIKGIDYKLNSHTPIRYTDDKTVTIYDALGFIQGEWTVTGEITMAMDETINFRDVTDTTGGQSYNTANSSLTVTKGRVTVIVTGSSATSGYGTSSTDKTTLHDGNRFTVSVDSGCHLISVRAYGNNGPVNGVHLHMLSWSGALSTDTSMLGQSKAIFTDKISRSANVSRSINTPSSTYCDLEGMTELWGLEVVYSLPNPGPDATDPGANADDMIFNDANNTGVTVRTLGYYFAGGTGTSIDPFQIKSPTHLRNLAKLQNSGFMPNEKYFSLENSFNWSGEDMEPIGKDLAHAFRGFFRGNCHTIQGLVVTSTYEYAGMFGYVYGGNAGRVTNLILSSPTINCRPTEASTDVRAGFLCGYIGGSIANTVSGIMVFAGNENSGALIKRATITANANAVVDCTDGDSGTNCVIVGGRNSATSIGIVSFVASMNDIVIDSGNIIAPKTGISTQARFVNQSNFTYTYYRHSGNSGAVVKE